MRMHMRRFTRLTNAFSKKVENHAHAVALFAMYYNFVKLHKAHRLTPALSLCETNNSVVHAILVVTRQTPPGPPVCTTDQQVRDHNLCSVATACAPKAPLASGLVEFRNGLKRSF
jgi:hypothetical protein